MKYVEYIEYTGVHKVYIGMNCVLGSTMELLKYTRHEVYKVRLVH